MSMKIGRRSLLKGTALAGAAVAAAAASSFPAPAISQGKMQLKMVTTWPKNFPGPRHRRPAPRGSHHQRDRGPHRGQVVRRWRAGAALRILRCRLPGYGGHVPRRRVLLAGQVQGLQLLRDRPLRADRERGRRLDLPCRRPGALGRARGRLQPEAADGREHGRPVGRLVQQGDELGRGLQGPQDAHAGPRRRGAASPRCGRRRAAGRRDLPGAAVGHDRRHRVGGAVERPRLRLLQDHQVLLLARLPRARHDS